MEETRKVERSEDWSKIMKVLEKLRKSLTSSEEGDGIDLPSAATEIEQLFKDKGL